MKECPACHRCFPDLVNHCPGDGEQLKFLITGDVVLDDRYQLESKIGQGGMGMVFRARHVFLKTLHAVKIILPDLVGNDPSLTTRFRQEAMAAAAIHHPNTINVTDYGIINGTTPFIVMEFVEGRSLHEVLAQQKRLQPALAVEIMLAVCAGVAAAHRMEIVHRDLKPLNILLREGESTAASVKVLDFGLAKIKSGELLGSFVAAQTQGMMGSPFYMAPEQWSDEEIDVRADIYSLGVILYQMLAGDVPFKGVSVPSIMNKHLTAAPVPLSERGVEVTPELERAVRRALEKDPAQRPQTVEEFASELRAALASLVGAETSSTPGIGTETVRIAPTDTAKFPSKDGSETSEQRPREDALRTIAGVERAHTGEIRHADEIREDASSPPPSPHAVPSPPASEAPTEALPGEGDIHERASETARQRAERTSLEPREAVGLSTQPLIAREAHDLKAASDLRAASEGATAPEAGLSRAVRDGGARAATTTTPRTLLIAVGALAALVFLSVIGGTAYYFATRGGDDDEAATVRSNADASADDAAAGKDDGAAGDTSGGAPAKTAPALATLPGGSFLMGRDDVPPMTDEAKRERPNYLLWMYGQWPAHHVEVAPFSIDRTEVTNAEYAEFVRETGHAPPPDVWDGRAPKKGEENHPVTNISYEDARAFAEWRSRRDGATYRLPTEEEWEYAARGGDSSRLFPWGSEWMEGRANLGGAGPKPVGSHPSGRTPQGVEDMIGNVWELTSSTARMYEGNDRTMLQPSDREKVVTRGGSYESRPDGDEPITATSRRWVTKDFRSPVLGFRLVRPRP